MKTRTSDIVALMSVLCFASIKAVEVFTAGPDGKPTWRESSEMRDRSNVPTPSLADLATDSRRRSRIPIATNIRLRSEIPFPAATKYRTRSEIPVPIARNHRTRSDMIPRPSVEDVIKDYTRRRSGIPRITNQVDIKDPRRRAASRRNSAVQKKNFIDRIFFTMPFGAQFPIFFTSPHSKKATRTNKKSDVALPRRRHPFRLQTWGRPVNYKALGNKRYLTPYIEQRPIARQQIIPVQGGFTSFRHRGSYNPRYFFKSHLLRNRNTVPYFIQRSRPYYTVPRSRYFLRRMTRSDDSISKKPITEEEEQNRAVINRELS